MSQGVLYIVSTPIGNLEDITLRALRVLKEVDFIAAEDTRHSLKLLSHFGISKPLLSCWSQKERSTSVQIIHRLKSGKSGALITDSGTPGISDPGSHTIMEALEEGIRVVPVPGCSALTAALSVSGLDTSRFLFMGFLPTKGRDRAKRLKELTEIDFTMVFYEAPHRILDALKDMLNILGNRRATLAREITKVHEDFLRGTLSEIIDRVQSGIVAGEYVIMVEGRNSKDGSGDFDMEEALAEMNSLMGQGLTRKEASREVSRKYGLKAKDLYDCSIGKEQ